MNTARYSLSSPLGHRIATIELSLRVYVYSLVGLVPIIGIPFALLAISLSRKARAASTDWNPADRYLNAARRLGPLGLVTTAGFLVVVLGVLPALWSDLPGCASGSS
jgi:hypothetical protein